MRVSWMSFCVVGVIVALAAAAEAQPAPEGPPDLYKRALEKANQGDYAGAIVLFKQAYQLAPNPKIECNIGIALSKMGERARAHAVLSRCVSRLAATNPNQVASIRTFLTQLEGELATSHVAVDITSNPPAAVVSISTFPDDETVIAPTLVWLPVGKHTVTARMPGHDDAAQEVEVTAGNVVDHRHETLDFTLAVTVDRPPPPPPPPVDTARPRSKRPALITLGVGGGLLVAGGVVHVLSRDPRAKLAGLSGDAYDAYLPTWHRYQYATIGLYVAGTATVAVGAYLYRRARTPAPMALGPTPDGRGAMLWLWSR